MSDVPGSTAHEAPETHTPAAKHSGVGLSVAPGMGVFVTVFVAVAVIVKVLVGWMVRDGVGEAPVGVIVGV